MKNLDKLKIQKIISKIETSNFDENDVDNLFMKLRAFSNGNDVFREVADFVAHNDLRNEGIANKSLESLYLSFKFFNEYTSENKPLNISEPFPLYIKNLMIYQIDKCNEADLKLKFSETKQKLNSWITTLFKDDKKRATTQLKNPNLSKKYFQLIQYLLGFIGVQPAFDHAILISQIINVIKTNELTINENEFIKNADKIILCVLLLLHDSEFNFDGYKFGYCKLSCNKTFILHTQNLVDQNGNKIDYSESFGTLQLHGYVILDKNGKDITISFPLMTTDLLVDEWCDNTLFNLTALDETHPNLLHKIVNFDQELNFNSEWKICIAQES